MTEAHSVANIMMKLRQERRLSLAALSRLCGGRIRAATLGNYERCQRAVTIDTLRVLADAYEVPVTRFFSGIECECKVPADGVLLDLDGTHAKVMRRTPPLAAYLADLQPVGATDTSDRVRLRTTELMVVSAMTGRTLDETIEWLQHPVVRTTEAGAETD